MLRIVKNFSPAGLRKEFFLLRRRDHWRFFCAPIHIPGKRARRRSRHTAPELCRPLRTTNNITTTNKQEGEVLIETEKNG
jgi:hypothetical protein